MKEEPSRSPDARIWCGPEARASECDGPSAADPPRAMCVVRGPSGETRWAYVMRATMCALCLAESATVRECGACGARACVGRRARAVLLMCAAPSARDPITRGNE